MSEESNHSLILQQLLQFVQPCIVQEIVRDIQVNFWLERMISVVLSSSLEKYTRVMAQFTLCL